MSSFQAALTIVMLISDNIDELINYVGFANWVWYAVAVAGQIYWRIKYPNMKRPIKVRSKYFD